MNYKKICKKFNLANLNGAILNGATLGGANLGGANLNGAILNGATLVNSTGADIEKFVAKQERIDIEKYIKFLECQVVSMENNLALLSTQIKTSPPQLDPNWRLDQGYLFASVRILKDLKIIMGQDMRDDFYPDLVGLRER